jgi:tetratricopeptide (TPR) repeat protein
MGLFDNIFGKKDEQKKINRLGKEYEINSEAMAQSQIGLDKYQNKDYKGAIDAFSNAINQMPKNQNFYTMRGTAYEDMGNDNEAEKDFRKTLELIPNDYVAAYRLGMVFFRKKDFENAIKWLKLSYENAVDVDHESLGLGKNNILFVAKKLIAGNLGNFLTQVKKYDEGFIYLDAAIKLDPNYPNPYMAKGGALAQMGRIKEGISYLEKAEKLGVAQATMLIQILKNM